jgi:hypothetical protein
MATLDPTPATADSRLPAHRPFTLQQAAAAGADRLRQGERSFRHADEVNRLLRGHGDLQRLWIGQSNVLRHHTINSDNIGGFV